jgi:hypothetical protein
LNDPKKRYTGKDLEENQERAVNEPSHQVKNMINHETGNVEPHVAMHWGGPDVDLTYQPDRQLNSFLVKDGKVHVASKNGAVMSTHPTYSHDFATEEDHVAPKGRLFSFWVPKSKIHADLFHNDMDDDLSGYQKLTAKQKAKADKYIEDTDNPREDLSAGQGGHHHIMPGSYEPLSPSDMEEGIADHAKIFENSSPETEQTDNIMRQGFKRVYDNIRQLHQQTFPHFYKK